MRRPESKGKPAKVTDQLDNAGRGGNAQKWPPGLSRLVVTLNRETIYPDLYRGATEKEEGWEIPEWITWK